MSRDRRIVILVGLAGIALASLTLWPTARDLTLVWANNRAYQYAWLVLPMVAYLLWERHGPNGLPLDPRADFSGLPVALLAGLCWGAATLMNVEVGRQFALVLAFHAIAMSTLGWRAYLPVLPILGLLFLMVPNSDLLLPALQRLTVGAIEAFAVIARLPHGGEGYALSIGENQYIVLPECAGLAYFNLGFFLGYSFGLLMYRSLGRIFAMTLFGGCLGILMNVLRVNAIVLIDWLRGSQMDLADHGHLQWVAFALTFGLLLYVLARSKPEPPPVAAPSAAQDRAGPCRFAPLLVGLVVLIVTGSVVWLTDNEPRSLGAAQSASLPGHLAGWQLALPAAQWVTDPRSGTKSLSQMYRHGGRELTVRIVAATTPAAKLPDGHRDPGDGRTWREQKAQDDAMCLASDCLILRHVIWKEQKTGEQRHVYYAYSLGRFATASKFALRAAQGWQRLRGSGLKPLAIAFVLNDPPSTADKLADAFRTLQAALDTIRAD